MTTFYKLFVLLLGISVLEVKGQQACTPGWIQNGEKCYFFSSVKVIWPVAASYCSAFGAKLAEPITQNEISFLGSEVMQLRSDFYFIGVSDFFLEGKWVYASTRTPVENIHWSTPPDNWQDEDCIIIGNSIHGKWADAHCGEAYKFICEYTATFEETGVIVG